MTAMELKRRLHLAIEEVESIPLLEDLLQALQEAQSDSPVVLTPVMKEAIDAGLADKEAGRVLTNEAANQEIEEWLNE